MERPRRVLRAAGLGGILALAACGGSSGPSNQTNISSVQAGTIGATVATEVGSLASGLTQFSTSGGQAFGGFFAPRRPGAHLARLAFLSAPRAYRPYFGGLANLQTCTPSESSSADADQDGVPDDDTITFTAGNCTDVVTDPQTNTTTTTVVTGTVRIQDTEGPTDVFGYLVTVGSLHVTIDVVTPQQSLSLAVGVNGQFGADVAGTGAASAEALSWTFNFGPSGRMQYATDVTAGFTPGQGLVIDPADGTLPAGDFAFAGSFRWSGSTPEAEGRWRFDIVTPTPLAYDGSCTLDPPFTGGVIRGRILANVTVGFEVVFNGCGNDPTIAAFDDNVP
jgi:hypothetical protein